ncbi:MAG: hypothetical protein ACXAC7_15245 [Candidatus Hodarchaeales archaeon]|jgi:hypothetical protein
MNTSYPSNSSFPSLLSNFFLAFKQKLRQSLTIRWQLFIVSFLLYWVFTGSGIESPNIGSRFLLTRTIVENESFIWPANWSKEVFWYFPDYAVFNGNSLSDKAPGMSFLLVPVYWLAKIIITATGGSNESLSLGLTAIDQFSLSLILFFLVIIAAFGVVRIYDIARLLGASSTSAALIAGIGGWTTLYLTYAPGLFPSTLIAFFLLNIIYHLQKFDTHQRYSDLMIAGIFAGYACVIEYALFLIIPWFLWFIFAKNLFSQSRYIKTNIKQSFLFAVFFIVGVLPLFLYNFILFETPLKTTYFFSHWTTSIHFYFDLLTGLDILLIRPNKGLFFFNPILIFGFIGWFLSDLPRKYPRQFSLFFSIIFTVILFYAKNFDPTGGVSYGPRYIIPIIPLFILGLIGWIPVLMKSRLLINLTCFFGLWTALTSWIGALGIGLFPEPPSEHPIFQLAWKNISTRAYHPFLLNHYNFVFWTVLIFLITFLVLLNWPFVKNLMNFHENLDFEFPDLFSLTFDEHYFRRESKINLVSYFTCFSLLLFLFMSLFLLFGTSVLSDNYPGLNRSLKTDQFWIILSGLFCFGDFSYWVKNYRVIQGGN